MDKIILLWNVHANEGPVTEEMAKLLKTNLEKKGHKIEIIEAPEEYRAHRRYSDAFRASLGAKNDGWGFKLRSKFPFPGSSIIELHVSHLAKMVRPLNTASRTKTSRWKTIHMPKIQSPQIVRPLELITNMPGWHILETPAKHETGVLHNLNDKAVLKTSKAANCLSPIVVKKVAHLIDSVVNTEQGVYHKPRRPLRQKKEARRRRIHGMHRR